MIACKELNKSFASKKAMFAALKAAKQQLIDSKKAAIKFTDPAFYGTIPILKSGQESKELNLGDSIYPVINTINVLDSHKDVHLRGIWDKSAKEQQGKVYYIINHDLSLGKVISYPKEVEIMVKDMTWSELGVTHTGKTQALIFKAKLTEKSNKDAYEAIKSGEQIQNSVRMQYVRLDLAVNSGDEDYKEEKSVWDKYAPEVVNKEALEDGYFWAVHEAKIYLEGSAVLFGSNSITPVMYEEPKVIEPPLSTQAGPSKDTRKLDVLNKLSNLTKL